MMETTVTEVDKYLASLPDQQAKELQIVRSEMLKNLSEEYEEGIQYGMIAYYIPHSIYPAGYHCDPTKPLGFAIIGAKKNYLSLHLMCVYGNPEVLESFTEAYRKSGKKLDMGKACINFKRADDLALNVIGEVVKKFPASEWIAQNQKFIAERAAAKKKKTAAKAKN